MMQKNAHTSLHLDELMGQLSFRHQALLKRVEQARAQVDNSSLGENTCLPNLLPVTKGQPLAKVQALYKLGFRRFGENYVQELASKAQELDAQTTERPWVYIGRIQSNKTTTLVELCDEVQTLASAKHARKFAEKRRELRPDTPLKVYLQANLTGESSKDGLNATELRALAKVIQAEYSDVLSLQGVMSIPPKPSSFAPLAGKEMFPKLYSELRDLADDVGLGKLSLGMSQDLEWAVLCGSDELRIGTDWLGQRAVVKQTK